MKFNYYSTYKQVIFSRITFCALYYIFFNVINSFAQKPEKNTVAKFSIEIQKPVNTNNNNGKSVDKESITDSVVAILNARLESSGISIFRIEKSNQTQSMISVEIEGENDLPRITSLITTQGNIEFWETYNFNDLSGYFTKANSLLGGMKDIQEQFNNPKGKNQADKVKFNEFYKKNPLFSYLTLNLTRNKQGQYYPGKGPMCGYAEIPDTAIVNELLTFVKDSFPKDLKFSWTLRPEEKTPSYLQLIALKVSSQSNGAALQGNVIKDANPTYLKKGSVGINLVMNSTGSRQWQKVTEDNIGKSIAIVFDGHVYSYPRVNEEIPNGYSSITGNFTATEATDLAIILRNGPLPSKIQIVNIEYTHSK